MAEKETDLSGAETLRKTRTFGKVRCHNPSCMGRLTPSPGEKHVKCATCGMEYRVAWVNPELPRIRGPVWNVNRKLAQEAFSKFEKKQKGTQSHGTES